MTGHHWGPKLRLQAGYRTPSLKQTSYLSSLSVTDITFFIVQCGIEHLLYAMCVWEVWASFSPLGYLCAKFHFFHGLRCWASPQRQSHTHPLNQSPTLFDALQTEAFTLQWGSVGTLFRWDGKHLYSFMANTFRTICTKFLSELAKYCRRRDKSTLVIFWFKLSFTYITRVLSLRR